MSEPALDAYLICATPRSGSTLLCGLLTSSGVAGRPASFFNRAGLHDYAIDWQLTPPSEDGGPRIDPAYVRAARTAGSTPNGVFGGRVMAETRPQLLADLAAAEHDRGAGADPATDLQLLTSHLGRLGFVHLRRGDVVGQAVSWAKSLQTHFWHPGEVVLPGGSEPHYDGDLIDRLVTTITTFEAEWRRWFAAQRIEPYEVTYEELAADPLGTAKAVLDHLGLELPAGHRLQIGHRRQADQVNADWVARYRAGRSPGQP